MYFLINLAQSVVRINPGQGQNNQLFEGLLVSVKSIEKVTSTQEQVQKYCNWRKEAVSPLNESVTSCDLRELYLFDLGIPIRTQFSASGVPGSGRSWQFGITNVLPETQNQRN